MQRAFARPRVALTLSACRHDDIAMSFNLVLLMPLAPPGGCSL